MAKDLGLRKCVSAEAGSFQAAVRASSLAPGSGIRTISLHPLRGVEAHADQVFEKIPIERLPVMRLVRLVCEENQPDSLSRRQSVTLHQREGFKVSVVAKLEDSLAEARRDLGEERLQQLGRRTGNPAQQDDHRFFGTCRHEQPHSAVDALRDFLEVAVQRFLHVAFLSL